MPVSLASVAAYLAVIDSGGFRAAASQLGVTQGAVSQQVRRLESDLAASLVHRDPAGCRPAPGTEAFLRYARTLLDVAGRAERLFSDPELVVGAASNIGIYLLQPLLKAISDAHADHYRIRQYLGTNRDVIDRLVTGDVDVALTEWWEQHPGFDAITWREENLVVIVGPDHPWAERATVSVDELAGQTILGGEPASGTGTLLQNVLGAAAARLPATVNLGSTAAVKEAVHAGLGISLVLQSAADADRGAGRLHTLSINGPPLRKPLWLAHRVALVPEDPAARFAHALAATAA